MATAEVRGISPEQRKAYQQIGGFFGQAEKESPAAAGQLVNVVGGLIGEQQTTQEKLQDGMKNIDVGLALIGDWLKETGADGFEVRLGLSGGVKKSIGRSQVKFPTASDLIRVGGRVNPELQKQIPPLLSSFSRQIRGGLDVGLSPREIVGGLVAESVGSRPSANGSAALRSALEKPLGGHFEWIREVLGVPDVAGQPGFKPVVAEPKPVVAPKPLPEVSRAEAEFIRKKNRIKQYLTQEGGMDFLGRSWDGDKWEHVGVDGFSKKVYKPLGGVLAENGVCFRKNIYSDFPSRALTASNIFREGTAFLKRVQGPNFVRVYAHAPLSFKDGEGIGEFQDASHWELVDFVDGVLVNRVVDRERGTVVWPEALTPATRLRVLLAACECEHEATHLSPPAYLIDLKTDAFILQSNGIVKMVDAQPQNEYVEHSKTKIAEELVRLCIDLFPGGAYRGTSEVERAIKGYLNPKWDEEDRKWQSSSSPPPAFSEIINNSELPGGVELELMEILKDIRSGRLKFDEIPMSLANRILPIAQRLEREEGAVRAKKLAAEKRQEIQRRAAERGAEPAETKTENWEGALKKLIEDPFAQIAYEQTQSVMAAAAAFSLNAEISNGLVGEDQFIGLVKRIAALSQNMRPKKAQPQLLLQWPAHQRLFLEDEISKTTYEATGSIVAAAAAFSLREEIMAGTIAEEKFVPFVREVATLVQKTRSQIKH